MVRINRSGGAICAAIVVVFLLAAGGRVIAAEFSICWDGGAPGDNWTDADNWDTPTAGGPRNVGILEFLVTIGCLTPSHPAGAYDPVHFNVTTPVEITDLLLRNDSRLVLDPGTDLTVLRNADLAGIIDAQGGNFTACGTSAAFTGDRARVYASDGSTITICAPAYSSMGIWRSWDANGYPPDGDQSGTWSPSLMRVTGGGALLDLSSVGVIDAGFSSGGNDHTFQQISALDGGVIDLRGVQAITAPDSGRDRIDFVMSGPGSDINLAGLQEITSAYHGYYYEYGTTRIENSGGEVLDLDSLASVDQVDVVSSGSIINCPSLTTIADSTFTCSDGSEFHDGSGPATYSSLDIWRSWDANGYPPDGDQSGTWYPDLMKSAGVGSLLDLSSVTSIDAGFSSAGNDHSYQQIAALDGGVIDLSGVQTITAPESNRDEIRFIASGAGSTLDMSALATITNAGNGGYRFTARNAGSVLNMSSLAMITTLDGGSVFVDIADGGHVQMGNVNNTVVTTTIDLNKDWVLGDAGSVLSVGSLRADSPVAIMLHSPTDRLEASGSLLLGSNITIKAPKGGTVSVGGDFRYTHTNTANLSLGLAHVECVGDWQWLEVGGTDFDLQWQFLPDDNFGYRQLVIGRPGHVTVVQLVDLFDNHQAGKPDALYLFGGLRCTGSGKPCLSNTDCPAQSTCDEVDNGEGGLEGLRILGGSTLVIGDLNVFALLDVDKHGVTDGVMERTRLHDLFEPGETRIRFNHNGNDGYIIRPGIMPPIGGIDARQPSNQDGSNPADWMSTELVFFGNPSELDPADFVIEATCGTAPTITGLNAGIDKVRLELDGLVPSDGCAGGKGAWMKITHAPSGSKTCVGYLPADVSGDRTSAPVDILDLIDHLNGVRVPALGIWQCDIDRSNLCAPADILSEIDLLNGAGAFDPWLGRTLPECP